MPSRSKELGIGPWRLNSLLREDCSLQLRAVNSSGLGIKETTLPVSFQTGPSHTQTVSGQLPHLPKAFS